VSYDKLRLVSSNPNVLVGNVVAGMFHCRKSEMNSRELDVEIHYSVRENADAPASGDVVVQMYKVR